MSKPKILIVDDSQLNREILACMLEDKYVSVKLKMESRQLKSLKDAIRISSWCSLT